MMNLEREDTYKHESFGLAQFAHMTSANKHPLFGSSIMHRDTILLRINTASMRRELSTDWYDKEKEIIEIEMSNAQFANLISSFNIGPGVPVTIRRLNGKLIEEPLFQDKAAIHMDEYQDHLKTQSELAGNLLHEVQALFETKKSLTKADKQAILDKLQRL